MITLSSEVCYDIKNLIFSNIDDWRYIARDVGINCEPVEENQYMDLTIATDDCGIQWNYQTGDNSFTGGAYGLPHWAVTSITPDSDPLEVYEYIIDELNELLPSNR